MHRFQKRILQSFFELREKHQQDEVMVGNKIELHDGRTLLAISHDQALGMGSTVSVPNFSYFFIEPSHLVEEVIIDKDESLGVFVIKTKSLNIITQKNARNEESVNNFNIPRWHGCDLHHGGPGKCVDAGFWNEWQITKKSWRDTYGPYTYLPSGKYLFEIPLRIKIPPPGPFSTSILAIFIDVVVDIGKTTIGRYGINWQRAYEESSNGVFDQTVDGSFKLSKPYSDVEVRTSLPVLGAVQGLEILDKD